MRRARRKPRRKHSYRDERWSVALRCAALEHSVQLHWRPGSFGLHFFEPAAAAAAAAAGHTRVKASVALAGDGEVHIQCVSLRAVVLINYYVVRTSRRCATHRLTSPKAPQKRRRHFFALLCFPFLFSFLKGLWIFCRMALFCSVLFCDKTFVISP